MEGVDNKEGVKRTESKFNQDIHTQIVKAGKRTYFFDVKSTRNDEYYLTITESKKQYSDQGKFHFEKHKIFLYKEDFSKFADSLQDVIDYIREKQPGKEQEPDENIETVEVATESVKDFSDIEFEDI
ncbi:MAG: DUF3276 family protein [Bacteroidetes bacterium]|nr:DUF3276 family protein [Bacteroidota bacterium]